MTISLNSTYCTVVFVKKVWLMISITNIRVITNDAPSYALQGMHMFVSVYYIYNSETLSCSYRKYYICNMIIAQVICKPEGLMLWFKNPAMLFLTAFCGPDVFSGISPCQMHHSCKGANWYVLFTKPNQAGLTTVNIFISKAWDCKCGNNSVLWDKIVLISRFDGHLTVLD